MSGKIVWILGAGFNRALGAPLLVDLFTPEQARKVGWRYKLPRDPDRHEGIAWVARVCRAGTRGIGIESQWEHAEEFLERLERAETDEHVRADLADLMAHVADQGSVALSYEPFAARLRTPEYLKQFRSSALQLLAGEVCHFLEGADLVQEKWQPYVRWAKELKPWDTVITFNYDWVLDLLLEAQGTEKKLQILKATQTSYNERMTTVYKLHGSANWILNGDSVNREPRDPQLAMNAAHERRLLIATPGLAKRAMVTEGLLSKLWEGAAHRLHDADAIVFVGYRIPPSDAQTRSWLADRIRENERLRDEALQKQQASGWTRFHTVLGPNTRHQDTLRLRGVLESLFLKTKNPPSVEQRIKSWPMGAEDFMSIFDRNDLLPES